MHISNLQQELRLSTPVRAADLYHHTRSNCHGLRDCAAMIGRRGENLGGNSQQLCKIFFQLPFKSIITLHILFVPCQSMHSLSVFVLASLTSLALVKCHITMSPSSVLKIHTWSRRSIPVRMRSKFPRLSWEIHVGIR